MLDITYETKELAGGRAAVVREDRGQLRIAIDRESPLSVILRGLNSEFARLLATGTWFQVWGEEVISSHSPKRLEIRFLLDRLEPDGVEMQERKGLITVHVDPDLTPDELAAVMNPSVRRLLDTGGYFQLYGGEVIDMCPASLSSV